jgi:prepilin-type N-terminal cleavage/methylation domain-containing protein
MKAPLPRTRAFTLVELMIVVALLALLAVLVVRAVSGSDVYAGGNFTTAGGSAANYIAKWDGSAWSALGSGMGGTAFPGVNALAVSGSDLYAGGFFTTAGGKVSGYAARANIGVVVPPVLSILRSGGDVALSWPASFGRFLLQQNPDVGNTNSWSNANYPPHHQRRDQKRRRSPHAPNQFFRLIGN